MALLERLLRGSDLKSTRAEVGVLERVFPDWGLLIEIRAHLRLRAGEPREALDRIFDYLKSSGDDVYLSPVIGCAAAIELGRPDQALEILRLVEARGPLARDVLRLRAALQLRAGHLSACLDTPALPTFADVTRERGSSSIVGPVGSEGITNLTQAASSPLDLRAEALPQLQSILAEFDLWGTTVETPLHLSAGPLAIFRRLVTAGNLDEDTTAAIEDLRKVTADAAAVEMLAFALLLAGRPRDAVDTFESAMVLDPKSARVHWAHAVACWRWGWLDRAHESIGRASALDGDDIVIGRTRRVLRGESVVGGSIDDHDLRPSQRLQLALIGVRTAELSGPATHQAAVIRASIDLALRHADRATAPVAR